MSDRNNDNYWDDDNVSEYNLMQEDIAEVVQTAEEMAEEIAEEIDYEEPEIVDASEDQIEYVQEQAAYDLSEKESNVIFNARLRLEQAKLYEMLINHSLFQGVDASDEATRIVENEIKHFIVKRLELLLGIRKPKPKTILAAEIELPFNEVEVDALKSLAYKVSKGQSAQSSPVKVSSQPTIKPLTGSTQSQLNPLVRKPILEQQPLDLPEQQPERQIRKKPRKTTVSRKAVGRAVQKTASKVKPKKNSIEKPKISSGGAIQRKLTNTEALALAKADLEAMKGRKSLSKMKGKEKQRAIKEVNDKHARVSKPNIQDFPSFKQQEMNLLSRELNGKNPGDVINDMAKNLLNARRIKPGV